LHHIERGGVVIPFGLNTRLQRFDVLFIAGIKSAVDNAAALMGKVARPSTATDLLTLAIGMILGFLIGAIGVTATYGFGLMLYATGLALMLRVHKSYPDADAKARPIWQSVSQGMSYVGENRLILLLLLFGLIPMFLTMPFQNLLVVFAEKIWDVGSEGLGILSAAAGTGAVAGSMLVASWGDSRKRLRRMMVSVFGFSSLLFAFALSPWFLLGLPLVFTANIFASVYGTLNNTAIQLLIPDHVRGRISSFLMMSFSLPMLGTWWC